MNRDTQLRSSCLTKELEHPYCKVSRNPLSTGSTVPYTHVQTYTYRVFQDACPRKAVGIRTWTAFFQIKIPTTHTSMKTSLQILIAAPAPAPLFYRHLQMRLTETLEQSSQNYDLFLTLSRLEREELEWWDSHMCRGNGKTLIKRELDLTIESDDTFKFGETHIHTYIHKDTECEECVLAK